MKRSIQDKIDGIIAKSKDSASSVQPFFREARIIRDSLSGVIRSKKDADLFKQELQLAYDPEKNSY